VVEDGVEDQGVGADGFAAVDGIVGEEEDVAFAEMGVDDDGVLGDGAAFIEQAGDEQGFRVGEAQDDFGPVLRWDDGDVVAHLFFIEFARLPGLLLFERLGGGEGAALGLVVFFGGSAAGGALGVGVHEDASAAAAYGVRDIEGHAVGAHDGKRVAVSGCDRAVMGNKDGVEDGADDAGIGGGRD